MSEKSFITFMGLVPKNLFSRFMGCIANSRISKPFIKSFAKKYKINLEEAEKEIGEYPTLNQFFIRHLKKGVRPIAKADDPKSICSPVDGKVAQFGEIKDGKLIQAKGIDYRVEDLLSNDEEAKIFKDGYFMTVYLAPTDYHRMHHYCDGEITSMRYIGGKLWPVNPASVNNVVNLFGINERLTTYMTCQHEKKKTAIVKVGATVVGKIKVAYHSCESNQGKKGYFESFDKAIPAKKGDELGLFEMGSTVVMLFEKDSFKANDKISHGASLKMGESIGELI